MFYLKYISSIYLIGIWTLMLCACSVEGLATQYRFIGNPDNPTFSLPSSWDTTSPYAGFPEGNTIGANDTLIIDARCQIFKDINMSGTIILNSSLQNNATFNLSGTLKGNSTLPYFGNLGTFHALSGSIQFLNFSNVSPLGGSSIPRVFLNGSEVFISNCIFENVSYAEINNTNNFQFSVNNFGELKGVFNAANFSSFGSSYLSNGKVESKMIDTLRVNSIYHVDIAGKNAFDQVITTSSLGEFDGNIKVNLLNNYLPTDYTEYKIIDAPAGFELDCTRLDSPDPSIHWEVRQEDGDVILSATPRYSTSLNRALDFGTLALGTNNYVNFDNSNIGLVKTIEFRIFPEVIDVQLSGGMVMHFGATGFQSIFQGEGYSAIDGETLNLVNDGHLYIKDTLEHRWQHITITDQDDNGRYETVYIDGQPVIVETSSVVNGGAFPKLFNVGTFQIGARIGTPFNRFNFPGRIDEVRLWSVVREEVEIVENWNKGLAQDDNEGLAAYYTMNQGIGNEPNTCTQTLFDFSGNEKHGSIVDFSFIGNHLNWVIAASCPSYVVKVDNTFEGSDTNWFEPSNWSLGQIPSSCHHVIIPSGKVVNVDQPGAHCYTLQVEGSINTQAVTTLDVWASGIK